MRNREERDGQIFKQKLRNRTRIKQQFSSMIIKLMLTKSTWRADFPQNSHREAILRSKLPIPLAPSRFPSYNRPIEPRFPRHERRRRNPRQVFDFLDNHDVQFTSVPMTDCKCSYDDTLCFVDSFICCITRMLMRDPVFAIDGERNSAFPLLL